MIKIYWRYIGPFINLKVKGLREEVTVRKCVSQ